MSKAKFISRKKVRVFEFFYSNVSEEMTIGDNEKILSKLKSILLKSNELTQAIIEKSMRETGVRSEKACIVETAHHNGYYFVISGYFDENGILANTDDMQPIFEVAKHIEEFIL